ncbi:acyl-CoA dehydrogenase family protein [Cupriavidus consociatus]|uniref:acyl-CoA dehydrogenase family protein n=1 Tax=Cupriavidus consociatus TaxID=2821357 RepID=UPI001AE28310|nr:MULTISPECIES: acyl-CoA dehydrogenase family protein [unclassified Cupriavidus]MBP0623154.1 acyl-CoA dehydrogenase family protein [Cupriavidus sp. LEh25]MDK2659848.1 acyl-CoA dehydrogenase family protein [Cupriavidus sp. LEh21]
MQYVSPWMDSELEMLQEAARRFFEERFVPREPQWAADLLMEREAWKEAGAVGLLCASIPEEYGGGGGTLAHDIVIFSEQARALIGSFSNTVHSGIVAHYLLHYGSEAQKKRWLPKMATGEMVAAIAMSEPDAGSDLQAIRTRAVREGDEYVINGAKTFITNGYHADLVFVVAKTDLSAKGSRGTSIIVVETRDLPGFRRGKVLEKLGNKGSDTAELFFDDVRVPVENLLGSEEGQGFPQLMAQLPAERLYIAMNAVAQMERAVAMTVDYVKQRKVFGQQLSEMQNTRFKLAECQTQAQLARVYVDNCIVRCMQGQLSNEDAAMAKWWATERCNRVVYECLQLHGGNGFIMEYPIARLYANARVGPIYGGSNEIMKEIIARRLLR